MVELARVSGNYRSVQCSTLRVFPLAAGYIFAGYILLTRYGHTFRFCCPSLSRGQGFHSAAFIGVTAAQGGEGSMP